VIEKEEWKRGVFC